MKQGPDIDSLEIPLVHHSGGHLCRRAEMTDLTEETAEIGAESHPSQIDTLLQPPTAARTPVTLRTQLLPRASRTG